MDLKTSSVSETSDPYLAPSKSTDLIKPKDGSDKDTTAIVKDNEGNEKWKKLFYNFHSNPFYNLSFSYN